MSTVVDDSMIRSYLLGELTDGGKQTVEQRLLTDDEFLIQLERVEEGLIDQYARGELGSGDRRRFEERFLTVPHRRESVEFARIFYQCAAETTSATDLAADSLGTPFRTSLRSAKPRSRAALIAIPAFVALVAAAAAVSLLIYAMGLRQEIDRLRVERSTIEQRDQELRKRLDEELTRSDRLGRELDREQRESARIKAKVAKIESAATYPIETQIVPVPPGLTREGRETASVTLSRATKRVRLQLVIEGPTYDHYRAELQTVEMETVWEEKDLKAAGDHKNVEISVPARLFRRSDYLISLSGAGPDGVYEVFEIYYLKAIRD